MGMVGTEFREILIAMRTAMTDAAILPDGRVCIAVRMNPPANVNDKTLIIVPLYSTALPESQDGHGRCATYKKSRINVYYRHNSSLDMEYDDDVWTTGDGGYYAIIDRLEDLFDLWMPQREDGTLLLNQPARLVMDNEPRKRYDDHTWGEGMIELEVEFTARRPVP